MAGTTKPAEYATCIGILMERFIYGDPISLAGMVELTGFHVDTLKKYVGILHRKKVIYICEWHKRGLNNHYYPYFTICLNKLQKDVPQPPYLTPVERQRNYRRKLKEEKEKQKLLNELLLEGVTIGE